VVTGVSNWLADDEANPDIASNVGYVGSGGPRFFLSLSPLDPDPHVGFIVANTNSARDVEAAVARTRTFIAEAYPEARGRVKPMWLGPSESGLVEVRLFGPDAEHLYENARLVEAAFRNVPGALNVENDWENKVLKARVEVDQARARRAGVTSQEIAGSLSTFLSGTDVSEYREGDDVIPITLRGSDAERDNLSELPFIEVYSASRDLSVPLAQIATITPEFQFGRIKRLDQVRTVTIRGTHPTLKAGELAALIEPTLAALDLRPGHDWAWGGEIENSAEAQANLFATMPYCFAAIVLLLIWQFNSIRRPLIIILTIPLSFIGAVAGLILMNATFGFMAILGLFSLAGIIINNGIVLIDRIDEERAQGKSVADAIVDAATARLRPIVMTTVTTVLGLAPLIAFGGALWYGMANVIAFGLAVGTVLTLGVVPVLYSLAFPERTREHAPAAANAQAA
jgi:multidrug efflux pump subunit AcrB